MVSSTGASRFSAAYVSSTGPNGAPSCRAAAASGNSSQHAFVIAGPGTLGAPVYFGMQAPGYAGPGAYGPSRVRADDVLAIIARQSVDFLRQPVSDVSMTIRPDGSGIAHMSSFRSTRGTTISTTVTWKCKTETVRVPV